MCGARDGNDTEGKTQREPHAVNLRFSGQQDCGEAQNQRGKRPSRFTNSVTETRVHAVADGAEQVHFREKNEGADDGKAENPQVAPVPSPNRLSRRLT
jgi:hypothetical protein